MTTGATRHVTKRARTPEAEIVCVRETRVVIAAHRKSTVFITREVNTMPVKIISFGFL